MQYPINWHKMLKMWRKDYCYLQVPTLQRFTEEPFCENANEMPWLIHKEFPLKSKLLEAQEKIRLRAQEPFKGVKELISQDKIAEPLEKGLVHQNFGLTVFKGWNRQV